MDGWTACLTVAAVQKLAEMLPLIGLLCCTPERPRICIQSETVCQRALRSSTLRMGLEELPHQSTASSPLRSMRSSSFCEGPLGFLSPTSHLRTVETLVLRTDASTA